jgi:two-component system, NtrC family, sensor kinase
MPGRIDHFPFKTLKLWFYRPRNQSLRFQLIGFLLILSLSLVIVSVVVQTRIVLPAFEQIEQQGALRDIKRCVDALNRDLEQISIFVNDWAAWDDTYQFILNKNTAYIESNLMDEAFGTSNFNLLGYYNNAQELVWGKVKGAEDPVPIELPGLWERLREVSGQFIVHQDIEGDRRGILLTSRGPVLLASRPIITSKRAGPIRGTLVIGRFLDEAEISGLASRSHVDLKVWTLAGGSLPGVDSDALDEVDDWSEPFLYTASASLLHAYARLNDLAGKPALLLRVAVPRQITSQGIVSARYAVLASLLGGFLIIGVAGWIIQRKVIGPLQEVATHADRLGRDDDLKARLNLNRPDEIGSLGRSIDSMIASIEESRKIVLDSAHKAGMADVASEVLHNVGNVVNSANTSIEVLEAKLLHSHVDGLERAARLLGEQAPHAAEFFAKDPRAPKLINYIAQLSQSSQKERAESAQLIAKLATSINHIRTIVAMQQEHSKGAEFSQEVNLRELVRETLLLKQDRITVANIDVQLQMDEIPLLLTNKSKLNQVLLNLVKNAVEAMEDNSTRDQTLLIRAKVFEGGVALEIRDRGPGIAPENLAKIFEHGFSTKETGMGIGLHYCANAIRSLGGRIKVVNCEPPWGASFQIWLPCIKIQNLKLFT